MNDERDQFRRRAQPDRPQSGVAPRSGDGEATRVPGEGLPGDHVDMRHVHFDDAFLDALSRDVPTPTRDDTEYQLAALLSGWRHDVLAEPAPLAPSIEEIEHAMGAEPAPRSGRVVRSLRVVAAAAAIAVVAAAGLTVVSEGAAPGDSLWSVKKVVFAQAASETQAAYDVRSDLERAEAALAAGQTEQAQELIAHAESQLGPVRDSGTREQMSEWIDRLRADEADATERPTTTSQRDSEPDATADTTDTTAPSVVLTTPPSESTTAPPETTTPSTTSAPSGTPTSSRPVSEPTPTSAVDTTEAPAVPS